MNDETWSSLKSKLAERDETQARLDQISTDIDQLASSLEQELAQVRQQHQAEPTTG